MGIWIGAMLEAGEETRMREERVQWKNLNGSCLRLFVILSKTVFIDEKTLPLNTPWLRRKVPKMPGGKASIEQLWRYQRKAKVRVGKKRFSESKRKERG
ncbi:hypothetical protein V6N12_045988 [Hibiscus sabdariffa]|uniref:Uncharacterized protein n=1 Tax=Hibiscus sabdariffa TaxID=183260 RepID=A0ABR2G4C9_9ROSI